LDHTLPDDCRVAALSCRSCLIDGEVVICGSDGIPVF
jgi:ATP-dependent DNA ligase